MLRVGLFDVGGELTPPEVSAQLTDLADATLEAALAVVAPPTFAKWGTPSASLAVLGLGKLGGRELTYSSDLDVVFVYSDEGQAAGGRAVTNFEVLSRLAQRLIHALSAYLDEGRLYEIDTRLRPSGQKGALVSSLAGFRAYHAKEAALWERQALIKARTVAGDRALGARDRAARRGARLQRERRTIPARMAPEIGRLRARMEKEIAQETAHVFNIKTGRGGLVDVEFLVQYLQLVHGPRLPSVRQRATADALAALARAGILPPTTRARSASRTPSCAASRTACASSRIARSSRSPIAPTSSARWRAASATTATTAARASSPTIAPIPSGSAHSTRAELPAERPLQDS